MGELLEQHPEGLTRDRGRLQACECLLVAPYVVRVAQVECRGQRLDWTSWVERSGSGSSRRVRTLIGEPEGEESPYRSAAIASKARRVVSRTGRPAKRCS